CKDFCHHENLSNFEGWTAFVLPPLTDWPHYDRTNHSSRRPVGTTRPAGFSHHQLPSGVLRRRLSRIAKRFERASRTHPWSRAWFEVVARRFQNQRIRNQSHLPGTR